jgi:hypothetical protein
MRNSKPKRKPRSAAARSRSADVMPAGEESLAELEESDRLPADPVAERYRALILSVSEGVADICGASGDAFINNTEGKIIVAGYNMPEPWKYRERVYTSYAAYLEVPETGDRVRIDMTRAPDGNWVALKALDMPLTDYRKVFVCLVADGAVGEPLLVGLV